MGRLGISVQTSLPVSRLADTLYFVDYSKQMRFMSSNFETATEVKERNGEMTDQIMVFCWILHHVVFQLLNVSKEVTTSRL